MERKSRSHEWKWFDSLHALRRCKTGERSGELRRIGIEDQRQGRPTRAGSDDVVGATPASPSSWLKTGAAGASRRTNLFASPVNLFRVARVSASLTSAPARKTRGVV